MEAKVDLNDPEVQADIQDQARNDIIDYYLEIDSDGNFLHPPVTDDELWEFIDVAYSVKIPRKVVTEGHRAPFEFVADLFFERTKNALAFANRNGGKTKDVSILNHLDMLFKKKCEIASAGAVLDQASKCYRYFKEYSDTKWFARFCVQFKEKTGKDFLLRSIQSMTEFGNKSTMEIITGSEKGLRSPHPNKARIDEVDLIPWDILQTGLSMAQSSDTVRGQNVFTSTRQLAKGSMQRMLETAAQKGIEVYEWDVWEIVEKCQRRCFNDPTHGTCPIYEYCKGKAHHCDGFYKIDDFIDKVRLLDRAKFETEWENKRPGSQKLVYWMFDINRHVLTPQKLSILAGVGCPQPTWSRVQAIDFGSSPGHPFVYLKVYMIPNVNAWLIGFEYVAEQKLLRDHANAIKSSPGYYPGELCYADWDAQDRLELAAHGIRTDAAVKDMIGIDLIGSLLQGYPPYFRPQLYVWHECTFTIGEFGSYQFPVRPDGKVDRTGLPEKVNDHTMDGVRYAIQSFKKKAASRYHMMQVPGL